MSSKNYAIFLGGGRSLKDHIGSPGGGGEGQYGPKKDQIIFERSLIHLRYFNKTNSQESTKTNSQKLNTSLELIY